MLGADINAQSIDNVSIPTNATACTNTTITVQSTQFCINYIYLGGTQSVVGNTLFLNLNWQTPGPICLGALAFIQEDFIFPTLPSGVNVVEVKTFLDGNQQNIFTGSITVASCCAALASFTPNFTSKCSADPAPFVFTNTSTGSISQEWYVNNVLTSTAVNFTPSFTAAQSYLVKLKVTDGVCSDSTTQPVQIFQTPVVDLGADFTACNGDIVVLDAGAGQPSYVWNTTGVNTQTINAITTGTYMVTVTSSDNCAASDTVDAVFNASPVVDLGNDTSICANSSLIIDAGSFSSYDWSTTETTQTIDAGAGGTFSVTVADAGGCEGTDDIIVSLIAAPVVDLGDDTSSICAGDSLLLDAGTHTSYNWSTGDMTQSIVAKSNQLYYVTVTNANNCSASDSAFIDFLTGPIVDLGNDTSICFGDNITFDAGSYTAYSWFDNSTMQTLSLDSTMYILGSNTISVDVSDMNGCLGQGLLTLEVNDCDTTTGIHNLSFNEDVRVYPNPTKGILVIELESVFEELEVSVMDVSGKTILSENFEDISYMQLNMNNLQDGLYFLVLRSGKQMEIRKISKK